MKMNPDYRSDDELTESEAVARRRLQRIEKSYGEICEALRCGYSQDRNRLLGRLKTRLNKLEKGLREVNELDPDVRKKRSIGSIEL